MIHNRCYDDTQLTAKWPAEVKGLVPGFLSNAHFQGHCILRDFKKTSETQHKYEKTSENTGRIQILYGTIFILFFVTFP